MTTTALPPSALVYALPKHKLQLSKQKCLISLWSTWYCLIISILHAYLLVYRVADIVRLVRSLYSIEPDASSAESSISNETGQIKSDLFADLLYANWNALLAEIVVRTCLVVASLAALVIFLVTSLKQVGNYSNDGVKFGRDFFNEKLHHHHHHHGSQHTSLTDHSGELVVNSNTLKMQQQAKDHSSSPSKKAEAAESAASFNSTTTGQEVCCRPVRSFFRTIWRHFLPLNSFAHLVSIVMLILSQLVFPDFKSFNISCTHLAVSDTEISRFFYYVVQQQQQPAGRNSSARTLFSAPGLHSPRSVSFVAELWSCMLDSLLNQVSATSADLSNVTLTRPVYNSAFLAQQISANTVELISISCAMISLYIRYGSVFWFTNKTLAFLVTFIGLVGSVEQLFQLYGLVYINRHLTLIATIGSLMKSSLFDLFPAAQFLDPSILALSTTPGPSQDNLTTLPSNGSLTAPPAVQRLLGSSQTGATLAAIASSLDSNVLLKSQATLLAVYVLLSVIVYLSAVPAYAFAYLKYKERFLVEESLFLRSAGRDATAEVISPSGGCAKQQPWDQSRKMIALTTYSYSSDHRFMLDGSTLQLDEPLLAHQASACCFNYCPHLIATIKLVLLCACKVPFCYDFIIYYNEYKDLGVMLAIIVEILHTLVLLFIWLTLTLRHDWTMHLQTAFSICHWIYHLQFGDVVRRPPEGRLHTEKGRVCEPSSTPKLDESMAVAQESCHSVDGPSLPPGRCRSNCANSAEPSAANYAAEKSVIYSHSAAHANSIYGSAVSQPVRKQLNYEKQNYAYASSNGHLDAKSAAVGSACREREKRCYVIENRHSAMIDNKLVAAFESNLSYDKPLPPVQAAQPPLSSNSQQHLLSTSDYLLNSETLYRNEIRKSIRNVLNQKQQRAATSASAVQLPIHFETLGRPQVATIGGHYSTTSPYRYNQIARPQPLPSHLAAVSVSSSKKYGPPNSDQRSSEDKSPARAVDVQISSSRQPHVLYLSHPSAASSSPAASSSSEYESRV